MDNNADKIIRLAEIKREIDKLNTEKKELEAFFLAQGGKALEDVKNKSITYSAPGGAAVTYTEAQKLTITAPAYLKKLFDVAYSDIIKEETTTDYKIKSPTMERMLVGLYTGNYTKISPVEVLAQLPCDDKVRAALGKKLKGANFETDKKNLIAAGFSEENAADYAFMYAEACVWDTFIKTVQLAGLPVDDSSIQRMIDGINISVQVDDTTKIKVDVPEV